MNTDNKQFKMVGLVVAGLAMFGVASNANGAAPPLPGVDGSDCRHNHVIVEGESTSSIADLYGLSTAELVGGNRHYLVLGESPAIGDRLCVPQTIKPEFPTPVGDPGRLTKVFIEAAEHCPGLKWQYLAGIANIESVYGTHGGATVGLGNVVSKEIVSDEGARGPMQHMPDSWRAFGEGGNINDFDDAAAASARHLCEGGVIDGTPQATYKALRRYYTGETSSTKDGNWYADQVFGYAQNHDYQK